MTNLMIPCIINYVILFKFKLWAYVLQSQTIQDQEEIQNELSRLDREDEESLEASLESLLLEDKKPALDDQTADGRREQTPTADELSELLLGKDTYWKKLSQQFSCYSSF